MATAHVSGALAWCSAVSGGRAPEAKDLILSTVDVKPGLVGKCLSGGRLNASWPSRTRTRTARRDHGSRRVIRGSDRGAPHLDRAGDDGYSGMPAPNVVKYSTLPIDESSFELAPSAANPPDPAAGGKPGKHERWRGSSSNTTYYSRQGPGTSSGMPPDLQPRFQHHPGPPRITADPTALVVRPRPACQDEALTICNPGASDLSFRGDLDARGAGRPRRLRFTCGTDSDDPEGPAFEWIDISTMGPRSPSPATTRGARGSSRVSISRSMEAPSASPRLHNGWLSFTTERRPRTPNQRLPSQRRGASPRTCWACFGIPSLPRGSPGERCTGTAAGSWSSTPRQPGSRRLPSDVSTRR